MSKTHLPKSTVETAITESSKQKLSKLYQGVTPEKGERTAEIVTNTLNNLTRSMNRPPCRYDDLTGIQERTVEFLQECIISQTVPLIEAWAVALGVSRKTLYEWFDNRRNPETADFLERVRASILTANVGAAYSGTINPITMIFYSKNSLGMSDRTEVNISTQPSDPMGDATPAEELQRRYLEAIEPPRADSEVQDKSAEYTDSI